MWVGMKRVVGGEAVAARESRSAEMVIALVGGVDMRLAVVVVSFLQ